MKHVIINTNIEVDVRAISENLRWKRCLEQAEKSVPYLQRENELFKVVEDTTNRKFNCSEYFWMGCGRESIVEGVARALYQGRTFKYTTFISDEEHKRQLIMFRTMMHCR